MRDKQRIQRVRFGRGTTPIDAVSIVRPDGVGGLLSADGEGFDTTAESQGKQGCDKEGEAKGEAFFAILSPDLAAIVAAWDKLPDAVKAGIMAMIHAVSN